MLHLQPVGDGLAHQLDADFLGRFRSVRVAPKLLQFVPTGRGVCIGWPVAASQLSSVHGLLSSMTGGTPGTQWAVPSHVSKPLHLLLSSQLVPAANGVCTTPVAGLHESAVRGLPSSMTAGAPTHAPAVH